MAQAAPPTQEPARANQPPQAAPSSAVAAPVADAPVAKADTPAREAAIVPPSLDLLTIRARLQTPADRAIDDLRATLEDSFRVLYPQEDADILQARARRFSARLVEPDVGPRYARELARSLLAIRDILLRRSQDVTGPLFAVHERWQAIVDAPPPSPPPAQPAPARAGAPRRAPPPQTALSPSPDASAATPAGAAAQDASSPGPVQEASPAPARRRGGPRGGGPGRRPSTRRAARDPAGGPDLSGLLGSGDGASSDFLRSHGAAPPDPDAAAVERRRTSQIYRSGEVVGGRTLAASTTLGQLATLHGILLPDDLAATSLLARTERILFVTSRVYTLTPGGVPLPGAEQAIPVTNGLPSAGTYFLFGLGPRDASFVRLDDGPRVVGGNLFFDTDDSIAGAAAERRVGASLARSLGPVGGPAPTSAEGPDAASPAPAPPTSGRAGRGVLVIVSPSAYPDGPDYVRPGSARLNAAIFTERLYNGLWSSIKAAAARRREKLGETTFNVLQQAGVGAVAARLYGLTAAFGAQFGAELGAAIADIRGVIRDAVSEEEIDIFSAVTIPKIGEQLVEQLIGFVGATAVTTAAGAGKRAIGNRIESARVRRVAEQRGPITPREGHEILHPGEPYRPPGETLKPGESLQKNPIAAPTLREKGWKAFIESLPPDEARVWWARRELFLRELRRQGLGDLVAVGSERPVSDRDINSLGPDSYAKIARALEILREKFGFDEEQLSVGFLINFLTDPRRAHMYTDRGLPRAARRRLLREHTEQVAASEGEAVATRAGLGAETGLAKAAGREVQGPGAAERVALDAQQRRIDELHRRYNADPNVETASEIQRLQLELNLRNPEAYFSGPSIDLYASRSLGLGSRILSIGEGLLDIINQRAEFTKQLAKAAGYLEGKASKSGERPRATDILAHAARDYTVSKYAFREFLGFERLGITVEPTLRRIAQQTYGARGIVLPPAEHATYLGNLIRVQETLLELARARARSPSRFAEAQYAARQVVDSALGWIGQTFDQLRPGEGFFSGLLVHPGVSRALQELRAGELRDEQERSRRAAPATP